MNNKKIFITGTDTSIGKTYVAIQLLKECNTEGLNTIGIKPVASDARFCHGKLMNDDALALQQAASIKLDYDLINPFVFEPAIAPHIAANLENRQLSVELLTQATQPALNYPADIHLVEGCGGWLCPLNDTETMADYVVANNFDVILVVGMRLGCLNHALLTYQAIKQSGARLIGWIANCIDAKMLHRDKNIQTLENLIQVPCINIM